MFNLEDDPQESQNLAKVYPEIVEELLKEAEEAIKDAPKMIRGDMIHDGAPVSIYIAISTFMSRLSLHTP